MQRGDGLAGFTVPDATDTDVDVAFPSPDARYGPVFVPAEVREQHPSELWSARRRSTVRRWDPASVLLTLDLVAPAAHGPVVVRCHAELDDPATGTEVA